MRTDTFLPLLMLCFLIFSCTENSPSTTAETPAPESSPKVAPPKTNQEKVVSPAVALPRSQRQESGKLHPVDEGQLSPDFLRFRQELLAALDRQDVQFIQQAIAPRIQIGFGADNGAAEFVKHWKLDTAPKQSELWQILRKVLLLGGTFDRRNKDAFSAPYLSATWPEKIEPFDYVVITGEDVRVRREPGTSGVAIAALSYDIVKLAAPHQAEKSEQINGETWPWIKIFLPDNSQGYVYGKYVHGPVDYRAYFERKNGRWQITSFLAGD